MDCDILIIGCGIAGACAALEAAKHFDRVVVISKNKQFVESNTYYAQGGIIYKAEDDDPNLLKEDILVAGNHINYENSVNILSQEGPTLVKDILIDRLQVPFSLSDNSQLDRTEEAAHSKRRIIHVNDQTGQAIENAFIKELQNQPNITLLNERIAVDLIARDFHTDDKLAIYREPVILGAYFYNIKTKHVDKILAKSTILATGGIGSLYLHSTNPESATGDGIAMAKRRHIPLINMEYTQFHPTAFFHRDSKRFLISESVRGEGGVLINQSGEPFMHNYHPKGDLAPRDSVTRGIIKEMWKRDEKYVLLDLSSKMSSTKIKERFPGIYKYCLSYHVDITSEPIPVVPAYHYLCGGIKVDNWGRTNANRLYAIGECACTGLHGANRLASTSLLEGLVWGYRAIQKIKDDWKDNYSQSENCKVNEWIDENLREDLDVALIKQDLDIIRSTMWNYVGPIRSKHRLERAKKDLLHFNEVADEFYREYKLTPELIMLRNAILVAMQISKAAYGNKENKGCHYRTDV